jgi:hypothetical protein
LGLRKRNPTGLLKLDNRSGLNRKYLNMMKLSLWRLMATLLLALVVAACGGGNGSSAAAPTDFKATPGNGQVTITWTAQPGVDYWMMYAQTATAIDIKNPPSNHVWATNITSPYVISGLTNGVTYSFAMNARTGGGKGGEQTASQPATPRFAGASWSAGSTAVTGTTDLHGLAYGTVTDTTGSSSNYVAVGTGGKLYKSTDGITWVAVTPNTALATDFKAAIYAFGKYIAVGKQVNPTPQGTSNIVSSSNLVDWTPAAGSISSGINAIASNGSTVVAVGDGGTAYSTTNGTDWAPVVTGLANTINVNGLTYSSAVGWVLVGTNGTLITSTDLTNWNIPASGAVGSDINAVAVNSSNVFLAVGASGMAISSIDGANWSAPRTLGTAPNDLFAVSTDSNQFLAVGQLGAAFTSTDGSVWSPVTTGITTADLFAILGGASAYVVVGANGTNITAK